MKYLIAFIKGMLIALSAPFIIILCFTGFAISGCLELGGVEDASGVYIDWVEIKIFGRV